MLNEPQPTHPSTERSARISRRNLTKGAAWAAPVIVLAQAAPAMAASNPCAAASYSWVTYGTSASSASNVKWTLPKVDNPGSVSFAAPKPSSGSTCGAGFTNIGNWPLYVTSSIPSTTSNTAVRYRINDGACNPGNYGPYLYSGAAGWSGIPTAFRQDMFMLGQNARSNFTSYYTFVAPFDMFNVELYVTDIDSQVLEPEKGKYNSYWDSVWLDSSSAVPSSVTGVNGVPLASTQLTGSGTASDPWRERTQTAADIGLNDSSGTIRLTFGILKAGQSIALRYSTYGQEGTIATGNWQYIGISAIRFTKTACVPLS